MTKYIDIVFDGPPSAVSGRFVEVEDDQGRSIKVGDWVFDHPGDDPAWARLRIHQETEATLESFESNDKLHMIGLMAANMAAGVQGTYDDCGPVRMNTMTRNEADDFVRSAGYLYEAAEAFVDG